MPAADPLPRQREDERDSGRLNLETGSSSARTTPDPPGDLLFGH